MTNDLRAALCRRYGEDAVREKLDEMGVRVELACGEPTLGYWECNGDFSILPDPVALAVLERVGEAMLWGDGKRSPRAVSREYSGWRVSEQVNDPDEDGPYWRLVFGKTFGSKSAALIAALSAKGDA